MSEDLETWRLELGWWTRCIYANPSYPLETAKPLLEIAVQMYTALAEREAVSPAIGTAA